MNSEFSFYGILIAILCCMVSAKTIAKDEEIEVKLQFLEYELEDFCASKNEAKWKFLNGSEHDLKKFMDVELKESDFYKHELAVLQKHIGKEFSSARLQRLVDVFSHPGAPLLGSMEFAEYRDYSIKLQELTGTMQIPCKKDDNSTLNTEEGSFSNSSEPDGKCSPIDATRINKVLFEEKEEKKLKELWTTWYKTLGEKNKKTKYDFVQQLTILDLEAEQNGEEEVSDYWLKQADTTWIDYDTVKNLWREILPMYEKLKKFMTSLVIRNFGERALRDEKMIPAHVLGSLVSHDWITAAEKLGAFDTFDTYKSLQQSLKQKKVEYLYKAADNQTAELNLGYLPASFYEKSRFSVSSPTCQHEIMDYCDRKNMHRAMFCANEVPGIRHYIQINENVMKLKYLILSGKEEKENGYLFREGPRESVLHDAMEGLSSLRALWPETLDNQKLLTNHSQQQKKMLSLLISALHVIPPLPYYLASDLWRIKALREMDAVAGENVDTSTEPTLLSTPNSVRKRDLENRTNEESAGSQGNTEEGNAQEAEGDAVKTYDTQKLTRDWWNYKEEYQGIGPPDEDFYEDYLQDSKIIWNKPYLSKFLGKILQFQIFEKSQNLTSDLSKIQIMLQKGKSESWQYLVEETFNITELSVTPLLKYFEPLGEFLDKGNKLKNYTKLFSFDDLNLVSQEFSFNPGSNEGEGEKPAEGSDALFFSLAAIAAAGVIALIVTIGRRRYKRRQRARERKRRLAEL